MFELISMITMVIDHVGLVFLHNDEFYRIVGRISFPLYAWGVVQGYLYTRSLKRYLFRLLLIALISQIPYSILFHTVRLNVVFTFILSLTFLYCLEQIEKNDLKFFGMLLIVTSFLIYPFDYGLYGLLLIVIYRYFSKSKMLLFHFLLNVFYLPFSILQIYSLIGSLLIFYKDFFPVLKINRIFYRSFYPVHLIFLILLLK